MYAVIFTETRIDKIFTYFFKEKENAIIFAKNLYDEHDNKKEIIHSSSDHYQYIRDMSDRLNDTLRRYRYILIKIIKIDDTYYQRYIMFYIYNDFDSYTGKIKKKYSISGKFFISMFHANNYYADFIDYHRKLCLDKNNEFYELIKIEKYED